MSQPKVRVKELSRGTRQSGYQSKGANAIKERGVGALDGRSRESRAVRHWIAEVSADLGGDLSSQQKTILQLAARDVVILGVIDEYLHANRGVIVNKKRRSLAPIVGERIRVADSLQRRLEALGLERRARPTETLAQILARHSEQRPSTTPLTTTEAP